ncbi:MAG: ATP-binding protein [Calditrichales bacterium]|nr:ATP-binding protein [Calditrichales bacterium]
MHNRKDYIQKLEPFIDKPIIKVIVGLRRAGKSTLIILFINWLKKHKNVPANRILYINKESLEFDNISNDKDLYKLVKDKVKLSGHKIYLFVDEVQMINNWQRAINSILADELADIYITGSNARLLSSELATLLTGRYIQIQVFPLVYSEFLNFLKKKNSDTSLFNQYLKYGGLPGVHHLKLQEDIVYQYISSVFDSIILKDVVLKNMVRNVGLLEKIIHYIFDNTGNIFSGKNVVDFLKNEKRQLSVETVYNYLKYLEAAFIIYKVPRFDLKGKRFLEVREKYYLGDIGLRHALLGFKEGDISGILENIIFLELKKRGYNIYIGSLGNKEVDFIIEKEKQKAYIQVCYLLSSQKTIEREFGILEKIKDNYPKYVLSMDDFWGDDVKGIKRLNIIDFLTGKVSIID